MRITRYVSLSVVALALVGVGVAAGQSPETDTVRQADVVPTSQLATLAGVEAVPMTPAELEDVRGLHVHFLDAHGGFHLAGDVKTRNNWKNIGGTDEMPVAPSYKGLCVAHAVGGIFIPTNGPITTECP